MRMQRIAGLVNYIQNQNDTYINKRLKDLGVTHGEARVIKILHEQEMTQDQLTKAMAIHKSAVTRILKTMEERHMIVRMSDESNRRMKCVTLTDYGESLYQTVDATFEDGNNVLTQHLNEQDKKELERLLRVVCNNMEVWRNER